MDAHLRAVIEKNRDKLATAIAELVELRDSLPGTAHVAVDRTIRRLGEALAGDVLFLGQEDHGSWKPRSAMLIGFVRREHYLP